MIFGLVLLILAITIVTKVALHALAARHRDAPWAQALSSVV